MAGQDMGAEVDRSVWNEFTAGMGGRWAQRRAMLRLLPGGGTAVVTTAVLLQVVAGLLPIGFVLATAWVIAGVPAAVAGGVESPAWLDLRDHLITAAALFFAIRAGVGHPRRATGERRPLCGGVHSPGGPLRRGRSARSDGLR